eukprot:scaffold3.g6224.t1
MAHLASPETRELADNAAAPIVAANVPPTEDAKMERAKASFPSQELAEYLAGGADKLKRRTELEQLLASQPWGDKSQRYFLTREQEYVGGLQGAVGIWNLLRKNRMSLDDALAMRTLLYFPGGLELHTELGHGTFVRGLETVAVYDKERQEFVCHSPTLTRRVQGSARGCIKWWPGGLGKTATHVILMARLIVGDKDYGPHAFVVQVRDLETHKPMPGVEVGDIGPKMGFNGVDNGFLRFEYVRVPRDAMLMRFAKVTPDGQYMPPPPDNQKASYATMVYVRASIVRDSGEFLGRAITIATRYTAVRRQTATKPGERELQARGRGRVLDYDNVQQTLLPLLSKTYALQFMGKAMMAMYTSFDADRARGNFALLPELHALSSGLKSLCTDIAADGIETCRRRGARAGAGGGRASEGRCGSCLAVRHVVRRRHAEPPRVSSSALRTRRQCGGHGYSILSGLPTLFNSYVQNVTWEGDNNVMYLQTARYLVKALAAARAGRAPAGSAAYLAGAARGARRPCPVGLGDDWAEPGVQVEALEHVAGRLTSLATEALARAGGGRLVFEGAPWNGTTVDLIRCARAHCVLCLHKTFVESAAEAGALGALGGATVAALRRLVALHGVAVLEECAADMLEDGYINGKQAGLLREQRRALVRAARPDAIALTDAFAYPDYLLNSALGRKDGDVYAALLEMAKSSPLNRTDEGPAWKPVLEPLLSPRVRSRL